MVLNTQKINMIDDEDWDNFVEHIYGRPYNFQQQNGCRNRGVVKFRILDGEVYSSEYGDEHDEIPEITNTEVMCVKFDAWLERDPKKPIPQDEEEDSEEYTLWRTELWWHRNFYPHLDKLIEDLHGKGLLDEGEYAIEIDW